MEQSIKFVMIKEKNGKDITTHVMPEFKKELSTDEDMVLAVDSNGSIVCGAIKLNNTESKANAELVSLVNSMKKELADAKSEIKTLTGKLNSFMAKQPLVAEDVKK
ncbi:MAG: hypothetical protein RSE41_09150 [Clostridia bacterium]